MLQEEDAAFIRDLEPRQFDGSKSDKFDLIVKNNLANEIRKKGTRTEQEIRVHTAQGIGLETYLLEVTPFFRSETPIVENARRDLAFKDLMRDFRYRDQHVQVKCLRKLYGNWAYISKATAHSISDSSRYNDFYLFGVATQLEEGSTFFTYEPAFAIETRTLVASIRHQDESTYINLDGMSRHPKYFQALCKELLEV